MHLKEYAKIIPFLYNKTINQFYHEYQANTKTVFKLKVQKKIA